MSAYYVNFNNQTDQTWTMAVYQTLPNSIGLDSVSWQQTTVPHSGYSGVQWDVTYDVAIANYYQEGGIGVYQASQTLNAALGTAWQCVVQDGVQQLIPYSSPTPPPANTIVINNVSNQLANLGIGMSGQGSVYKQGVVSGASAQFTVTPTYWVGLFNDLVNGEVISSNVIVGPQEIQFPNGMNAANVTASMSGSSIQLNIQYGQQTSVNLAVVDRLINARPKRSALLLERAKGSGRHPDQALKPRHHE
jgi:hypothetical protein